MIGPEERADYLARMEWVIRDLDSIRDRIRTIDVDIRIDDAGSAFDASFETRSALARAQTACLLVRGLIGEAKDALPAAESAS